MHGGREAVLYVPVLICLHLLAYIYLICISFLEEASASILNSFTLINIYMQSVYLITQRYHQC